MHPLLAVLLTLISGMQLFDNRPEYRRGDQLGKSKIQILHMGRDAWYKYAEQQLGLLTHQTGFTVDNTYYNCVAWDIKRLRTGVPKSILDSVSDALCRQKLIEVQFLHVEDLLGNRMWIDLDEGYTNGRLDLERDLLATFHKHLYYRDLSVEKYDQLVLQCETLMIRFPDVVDRYLKSGGSIRNGRKDLPEVAHRSLDAAAIFEKLTNGIKYIPLGLRWRIVNDVWENVKGEAVVFTPNTTSSGGGR